MGPPEHDASARSAPDLIHAVIGFRHWRFDDHGLLSLTRDHRWRGTECVATCTSSHQAPVNDCACGIYAWYDPCPRTSSVSDHVAGAVIVWGRVELHATGMRAQNARLVALALPLSRWGKRRKVVAIAEYFSVPAVPHRALRYVALAHGRPVPSHFRPPRRWAAVPQP
jgi:hypothetical protein